MEIEVIIIQRLVERGRVQIPAWGTFYLMEKPARWDSFTNTAFPRGKYVGFTASNATTENSLLPAVMKQMRCSMEVAESWISRKVNQWQSTLDSGSILLLQGLGSFRKNGAFVAEKNNQFDAHSFGFSTVMLHALNEPSALESKVAASLKMVSEQRAQGLITWRRTAVAAAIAALVSLGVYQSDLRTEIAGWFSPGSNIELDHSDRNTGSSPLENAVESLESVSTENDASNAAIKVRTASAAKKYYIVVGSFKIEDNATSLANELLSEDLEVSVLPGSLLKVGVGNYSSREDAKRDLSKIQRSINQHAWIYAY